MIHIYTGDGKGKTTAALGLALRAVGAGKKVLIVQFMKTGDTSEVKAVRKFLPNVEIKCFGRKGFINSADIKTADIKSADIKIADNNADNIVDSSTTNQRSNQRQISGITDRDIKLSNQALRYANKAVKSKKYNLLILDEINMALYFNLLKLGEVVDFIKNIPKDLDLVLTGRNANLKIIKLADLVTEMKKINHYYSRGVAARRGIEF